MDRRVWHHNRRTLADVERPLQVHCACILLVAAICLLAGCAGCDGKQADNQPASAVVKSPDSAKLQTDAVNPDDASSASLNLPALPVRATVVSNSPIDRIPEGMRYREALAAIDLGKVSIAQTYQQQLAKHPQYHVLADAIAAVVLADAGKYDPAMQLTEKISQVPIMQAESYMIAADVFRYQRRLGDAIGCLNQAVQRNPGLARAQRWLGILYYDIGAMQLATDHLRLAADIDSGDFGSLRLSSRIFTEYQNFELAMEDCQRALLRSPPADIERELKVRLADALRELQKHDDAIAVLDSCSETLDVLICRARCIEAAGQSQAALKIIRQALAMDADDPDANLIAGRLQLGNRDADSAIKYLQKACDARSSDHEAKFLLGRALITSGKREQGTRLLNESKAQKERFLEIASLHLQAIDRPQDVDVRLRLAELTAIDHPKAISQMWYRAAIGIDPGNPIAAKALNE